MKSPRQQDDQETAKEADVTNRLDIEEEKEEANVISHEALRNILCDFTENEFDHSATPLLVTPIMTTLFRNLEESIRMKLHCKMLLHGPSGVGKTTTLLYIGHMARAKGYVVFPVQARHFVNQVEPMSMLIKEFLRNWIVAVGDNILIEIFHDDYESIKQMIWAPILKLEEEKRIIRSFQELVSALQTHEYLPVVFLIDQCNAFNENPQTIRMYSNSDVEIVGPKENPVGAWFLDWNTFHIQCGGIFYGFSSAQQVMPPAAPSGNVRLFFRVEPMNAEEFWRFIVFLIKQDQLASVCESTHFQDFFELCGGIPREAREFGAERQRLLANDHDSNYYEQWKKRLYERPNTILQD